MSVFSLLYDYFQDFFYFLFFLKMWMHLLASKDMHKVVEKIRHNLFATGDYVHYDCCPSTFMLLLWCSERTIFGFIFMELLRYDLFLHTLDCFL